MKHRSRTPQPGPEAAAVDPATIDARQHARERAARRGVLVHGPSGATFACEIVDRSEGGAGLLIGDAELPAGELTLIDAFLGTAHEVELVWRRDGAAGFRFIATTRMP
jgi:hypothetical protein